MSFLKGKTAIITGAGYAKLSDGRCGSIGYGIATAYAKEGANLVITGRTESKLSKAKETLEKEYGVKVLAITADGGKEEDVRNVIDKTVKEYGRIDVVVNNAQASKSGVLLADHTKEDFDLAIYSGLYSTFYYMREALPF